MPLPFLAALLPALAGTLGGAAGTAGAGALGAGALGSTLAGAAGTAAAGAGANALLGGQGDDTLAAPDTLGGLIKGGPSGLAPPSQLSSLLEAPIPQSTAPSVGEAISDNARGQGILPTEEGEQTELDKLIKAMAGVKDPGDPSAGKRTSTAAPRAGNPSNASGIVPQLLQGEPINPLPTLGQLIGGF